MHYSYVPFAAQSLIQQLAEFVFSLKTHIISQKRNCLKLISGGSDSYFCRFCKHDFPYTLYPSFSVTEIIMDHVGTLENAYFVTESIRLYCPIPIQCRFDTLYPIVTVQNYLVLYEYLTPSFSLLVPFFSPSFPLLLVVKHRSLGDGGPSKPHDESLSIIMTLYSLLFYVDPLLYLVRPCLLCFSAMDFWDCFVESVLNLSIFPSLRILVQLVN